MDFLAGGLATTFYKNKFPVVWLCYLLSLFRLLRMRTDHIINIHTRRSAAILHLLTMASEFCGLSKQMTPWLSFNNVNQIIFNISFQILRFWGVRNLGIGNTETLEMIFSTLIITWYRFFFQQLFSRLWISLQKGINCLWTIEILGK